MTISKYDLCRKEIPKGTGVRVDAGENPFSGYELCASCGKPVKAFWEKLERKLKPREKKSKAGLAK